VKVKGERGERREKKKRLKCVTVNFHIIHCSKMDGMLYFETYAGSRDGFRGGGGGYRLWPPPQFQKKKKRKKR
jgi:hypothetical protein